MLSPRGFRFLAHQRRCSPVHVRDRLDDEAGTRKEGGGAQPKAGTGEEGRELLRRALPAARVDEHVEVVEFALRPSFGGGASIGSTTSSLALATWHGNCGECLGLLGRPSRAGCSSARRRRPLQTRCR